MLEELLNINPALYNNFIENLDDACNYLESKYRIDKNMLGYRPVRPDDSGIGSQKDVWSYLFLAKTKSSAFHGNDEILRNRVPTANAWFYFGWKCKIDFRDNSFNKNNNSYVSVIREGIVQTKLLTSIVFEQQHPQHTYYDLANRQFFIQNDLVQFIIYNDCEVDHQGEVYPILYRIAPKNQLNMFYNHTPMKINWDEMPRNMEEADRQIKENIQLTKIESLISEVRDMYKPFEYIEVKDNPFTSHIELKSRLDPSMKNYLENIKNGKVCPYCGEKIFANSRYCLGCGCPIDYEKEKEELYKELNIKDGKENI